MFIQNNKKNEISPIWCELNPSSLDVILRWGYHGDYQSPVFKVFVNGSELGSTTNTFFTLSGLKSGVSYRLDVLALSRLENLMSFNGYFYQPKKGNRFKISIPKIDIATNPDFYSYMFFWSDDGTEPTTELTELVGSNKTFYQTPQLEDGKTYKFRIRLKDRVGNLSDWGPTLTGSVNTMPEPVTSSNLSYSQSTRTATVTAVKPSRQDADVLGYALYSNHLPGYGLQSKICYDHKLAFFHSSQTLSYVSPELSEGVHKFCFASVDGSGLESFGDTLELNLSKSAGQLVVTLPAPSKPYFIDADPVAQGCIKVTVKIDDPESAQAIRIYVDGLLDGEVSTGSTKTYEYTSSSFADGSTHSVTASVVNGALESSQTDPVGVICDALPPAGNLIATLELSE